MLAAPARARVWMPREVGKCAVHLLGQHHARQLMGKRQRPKRHALMSLGAERRIEPDGAPNQKRGGLHILQPATHPCCQGLAAGRSLAAHVQSHHVGPLRDAGPHAFPLLAKHLQITVLHGLGGYLIDLKICHPGDSLLKLLAGGIEGGAESPDDDKLDEAAHRDIVGAA